MGGERLAAAGCVLRGVCLMHVHLRVHFERRCGGTLWAGEGKGRSIADEGLGCLRRTDYVRLARRRFLSYQSTPCFNLHLRCLLPHAVDPLAPHRMGDIVSIQALLLNEISPLPSPPLHIHQLPTPNSPTHHQQQQRQQCPARICAPTSNLHDHSSSEGEYSPSPNTRKTHPC